MRIVLAVLGALAGLSTAEIADAHPAARLPDPPPVEAPAPDSEVAEPMRSRPSAQPSGRGRWPALGVALAGAAAGAARLPRRQRIRITAAGAGAAVAVFLAGSAPHLVHHALEPPQAVQCQLLQSASHAEGTTAEPDVPRVLNASHAAPPDHLIAPPDAAAPVARDRAPPA